MAKELSREQQWLAALVGEWTYEAEASMAPGEPPQRMSGTETVRALGDAWIVCEPRADDTSPDAPSTALMTLGYDPAKGRVVGSFVSSGMPFLWVYDGALDASATTLTLDTEGPSLTAEGQTGRYRDTIAIDGGERTMTSRYLGDDGEYRAFMTMRYRRAR